MDCVNILHINDLPSGSHWRKLPALCLSWGSRSCRGAAGRAVWVQVDDVLWCSVHGSVLIYKYWGNVFQLCRRNGRRVQRYFWSSLGLGICDHHLEANNNFNSVWEVKVRNCSEKTLLLKSSFLFISVIIISGCAQIPKPILCSRKISFFTVNTDFEPVFWQQRNLETLSIPFRDKSWVRGPK